MTALTTSIDLLTGGVQITWTQPYNNEQAITAYDVQIADNTGTNWIEQKVYCDASKPSFVSTKTCLIPMSVFREAPYNYVFRDLIKVRAKAFNFFGWALQFSPQNTVGATVRYEP